MLTKAVEGGISGSGSAIFESAANEDTWKRGFGDGIGNLALSGGMAIGIGAASGLGMHFAGKGYSAVRERISGVRVGAIEESEQALTQTATGKVAPEAAELPSGRKPLPETPGGKHPASGLEGGSVAAPLTVYEPHPFEFSETTPSGLEPVTPAPAEFPIPNMPGEGHPPSGLELGLEAASSAPFGVRPKSLVINPNTKKPFGAEPELLINPNTKKPFGAEPELLINPNTKKPFGAEPELLINPNTRKPFGAETKPLIDPHTDSPLRWGERGERLVFPNRQGGREKGGREKAIGDILARRCRRPNPGLRPKQEKVPKRHVVS